MWDSRHLCPLLSPSLPPFPPFVCILHITRHIALYIHRHRHRLVHKTTNVPVVYMGQYEVVLRGDYPGTGTGTLIVKAGSRYSRDRFYRRVDTLGVVFYDSRLVYREDSRCLLIREVDLHFIAFLFRFENLRENKS
jgi:hypothetical protein